MMLRKHIGLKLTAAAGMTALVVISVFAIFNIRAHRRSLLAAVSRHADQLSEAVKAGTEYDMLLNQRERIHESITRMGNKPGIERIRVLNKEGAIIYSSDGAEIGRMVDKSAESCTKCHAAGSPLKRLETGDRERIFRASANGPRTLGIINPIYNSPTCWTAACHVHPKTQVVLGVLDVTMPLEEVDREILSTQIDIAVLALAALAGLSLVIGLLVRHLVGAPVRELVDATRHVAAGDLGYTVPAVREDELGMLAQSFNNMTRKLSEARMQLFQSDKLASVGRLAAGVAHEINNPLTGVLTYASYLLKRTEDQPEIQADLQVIVREALRSREIVKSLLDFARQSVPKKREADVNEVVSRAVSVVENQLSVNQVQLSLDLDPALPKMVIDANQIQQVLINLLVNASDAIGPGGGRITLSTRMLNLSPRGNSQIRRALCPKRHSLIDEAVRMGGLPAIRVKARFAEKELQLHLNPLYGGDGVHHGVPADAAGDAEFVCPECSASLMSEGMRCGRCRSPVYAFEVPPKGLLEGCVREGCGWQRWTAVDESGRREFLELKVSDTGGGIPGEVLPKIFEPFYSTKGQKGTGLGLAVVWGIIDNHEGTIRAESLPGGGTTFVVRIPVNA